MTSLHRFLTSLRVEDLQHLYALTIAEAWAEKDPARKRQLIEEMTAIYEVGHAREKLATQDRVNEAQPRGPTIIPWLTLGILTLLIGVLLWSA